MKKKLAIIGASYLQEPLIEKAKQMGIETHVFAWAANDVGEKSADFFYPISIVEKERIYDKCREIGVDGICTIATDLGELTVNYVADKLGLVGNSPYAALVSTNKKAMRECFFQNGDPSPKSVEICIHDFPDGITDDSVDYFLNKKGFSYPVIVKPTDRSGSRGIFKFLSKNGIANAVQKASEIGFEHNVLVEEFAAGQEYSVEYISWKGKHHFLQLTQKYTTGAPHFIETAHLEPAQVSMEKLEEIKHVVDHALTSLHIEYGASHTELKIDDQGNIRLIEIGGRMGGDFIGSTLVHLSTGIDFVRAVIMTALGEEPNLNPEYKGRPAGVRFIFNQEDVDILDRMKKDSNIKIVYEDVLPITNTEVSDSSTRFGCYVFTSDNVTNIIEYLPENRL